FSMFSLPSSSSARGGGRTAGILRLGRNIAALLTSARLDRLGRGVAVGILYIGTAVFKDLRLALEDLGALDGLLVVLERATGALKLVQCHGWLHRLWVEGWFLFDLFVDALRGV